MQSTEGLGSSGPSGPVEISTPLPTECYVVIADYDKDGADEISLKAGDSLEVFIRNESGLYSWCR